METDQIRQKLYYHWCDREEKLLLFPEFVSRSARFLKVMRDTAVHSLPVPGSRFPVPDFSNIRNDPGKVESNFFCYAAIRITYLCI